MCMCVCVYIYCILQPVIFVSSSETEHANSTTHALETEPFRCQGNSHGSHLETVHWYVKKQQDGAELVRKELNCFQTTGFRCISDFQDTDLPQFTRSQFSLCSSGPYFVFVVGAIPFAFEVTSPIDWLPFKLRALLSFVDEGLPRKLLS